MRIYHGHFVHPCKQAYERLLQGIADASHRQLPRDIATALWSIAKISELDWLEAWEDLYVVEGVDALKSRMLQAGKLSLDQRSTDLPLTATTLVLCLGVFLLQRFGSGVICSINGHVKTLCPCCLQQLQEFVQA